MTGLPTGHPLEGCVEKYGRAYEHFNLLQEEIRARYAPGQPEFITIGKQTETEGQPISRHFIETIERPPVRWATIIGDIVHNLRSALDHLVFELSFLGREGVPPTANVAFPVCLTRVQWQGTHVQTNLLQGLVQKHRAMLYRYQPCYRRNDSASARAIARRSPHPFADLNDLWNDDKHRMLQPVLVHPREIRVSVEGTVDCRVIATPVPNLKILGRPLKAEAELTRVPIEIIGPNPDVAMGFDIQCEVGLRDGVPIRDRLAGMASWVKNVIEAFEPEFDTAKARRLWDADRGGRIKSAPPVDRRRMWLRVHEVEGGGTPPIPHWAPRKGPDGGSVY